MPNLNDEWVNNSVADLRIRNPSFMKLLYFTLALCTFILVHSSYINVKKRINHVNIATNIAAVFLLLETCVFIYCFDPDVCSSPVANAGILAFFANGICAMVIQATDNCITFSRYTSAVQNVAFGHKSLAFLYVIVFLYGSWIPWFTFVPFWINMNEEYGLKLLYYSRVYIYLPFYIIYDFFCTALLLHQFEYTRMTDTTNSSSSITLLLLAKKAIVHNLLSITGVCFHAFYPKGFIIQNIFIVVALHFLFNWKGSKYLFNPSELFEDKRTGVGKLRAVKFHRKRTGLVSGSRSFLSGLQKSFVTIKVQVQPKIDV